MSTFLNRLREHFTDVLYIFRQELLHVVKDEGVLLFLVIVPLGYPLIYSWIYNNESLRETPVVVVDQSHSALSRQFLNDCDASPDVHIKYYAQDLDEARSLVSRQLVRGIYLIPSDFAECINRGEQAHVSVYCDMSLMLAYKAIYQTAMVEAGRLGAGLNIKKAGNYTKREDAITAQPLAVDAVVMYNNSGGYGSCVLPAVLMLILQQALALGIGMAAGTARERHRNGQLIPDDDPHYRGAYRIVWGKTLCYCMIGAVAAAYLSMAVPAMFSFPQLGTGWNLFWMLLPYTLASVFFGLTVSCLVRYRENVMLIVVFTSLPLLFLAGVSWPQSGIPEFWQSVAYLFPSTFGIRGFIRMNSMGATLHDINHEYQMLWIQVVVYFLLACIVYRWQIIRARKHAIKKELQKKS